MARINPEIQTATEQNNSIMLRVCSTQVGSLLKDLSASLSSIYDQSPDKTIVAGDVLDGLAEIKAICDIFDDKIAPSAPIEEAWDMANVTYHHILDILYPDD